MSRLETTKRCLRTAVLFINENEKVIQVFFSFVVIGVSIVGLFQLVFIYHQLEQTKHWNQVDTQNELLNNLPRLDLERTVWKLIIDADGDPNVALPKDLAQKILDTDMDHLLVKTYLNKFEDFAGAVRTDRIDYEYAFRIHGHRIVRVYCVFKNYIDAARTWRMRDNPKLFVELEMLAEKWLERRPELKAQCSGELS